MPVKRGGFYVTFQWYLNAETHNSLEYGATKQGIE